MKFPNLVYEKRLWKRGFKYVAGADEVGRGSLAGPVVCGVVVFDKQITEKLKDLKTQKFILKIDDSKKLTPGQRDIANIWIKKNCLTWGIGVGSTAEINKKGIVKATASGFRRAVANANRRFSKRIDYILFDAFYTPYIRGIRMPLKSEIQKNRKTKKMKYINNSGNQMAIINGDEKSISIAAASIVAKVYRDKLMMSLDKQSKFKKYNWGQNKGYGTKNHITAIKNNGITKYHRRLFITELKKTPIQSGMN